MKSITKHKGLIKFCSEAALLNASVFDLDTKTIIVDTMLRPMDSNIVKTWLREHGKNPDFIINTHWHSDHCFGNRILKNEHSIVIAHPLHSQTLLRERNMFKPGKDEPSQKSLVPPPDILVEDVFHYFDGEFVTGQDVSEDFACHIFAAPGHSPDMLNVWLPKMGILLAGDNILACDNDKIALPYFFWGNCRDLIKSLEKVCNLNPEIIIPGHGEIVPIHKVKDDISYLKALLESTEAIIERHRDMDFQALLQLLLQTIKAEDIYPDAGSRALWVPSVHELNIKRLLLDSR